jgi:hypothetical protein
VSQPKPDPAATAQPGDGRWRSLYKIGAAAPLIALAFYLTEFSILFVGEPYPTTVEGWYALVQRSKLLGLWYLNALDIFSFALLGLMFLALYVALRHLRPAWTLIAIYLALLGVVVFIVPRVLQLALLPLSDLHAAAAGDAQRTLYLAAGEALSQVSTATPQTLGFLFMAAAGLIVSVIILRSSMGNTIFGPSAALGKVAGCVGIAGFVAALANYASWLLAPVIAEVLMPINGLLWFVWWIVISVGLFRLAKATPDQKAVDAQG